MPVDEVVDDVLRAFHHPALRDERIDIHREMFNTVREWADEQRSKHHDINRILGSESVKNGKNHVLSGDGHKSGHGGHSHGSGLFEGLGHGQPSGSLWSTIKTRDLDSMGVGDGHGGVRPDYAHSRPSSSQGRPTAASPNYGYKQDRPPHGGEAASYYYSGPSSYDRPHSPERRDHGGYDPDLAYGRPEPASRYDSDLAYGRPPPPSEHYGGGYGAPPPGQYPRYGGAPPQGYGGPPPPHAGGHYGAPPPAPYPDQRYGGPPPHHHQGGGYPGYGQQQYGGGYGRPPYP